MIYCTDISNIVKEVYEETVIDEIDLADIKKMLSEFNYESCKIAVNCNNLTKQAEIINSEPLSDLHKEEYFGTEY